MLTIEIDSKSLYRHERIVLERGGNDFLLPVTVAHGKGVTRLMYLTEGFLSLREYDFHGDLYRIFSAVRAYVRCLAGARDMLLRPEMVFGEGDKIFVRPAEGAVRIIYGAAGAAAAGRTETPGVSAGAGYGAGTEAAAMGMGAGADIESANSCTETGADKETANSSADAYGEIARAVIPILGELARKTQVTGSRPAMTGLAKKIRMTNPDFDDVLKIIDSVERQWNYMQPVSP